MIRALVVAMVAGLAVVAVSAPSQAADRCVSHGEYRQLKVGMTGERVNDIIGYPGKVFSRSDEPGFHSLSRKYQACGGGFAIIDLQREKASQPYRVTQKFVVWA